MCEKSCENCMNNDTICSESGNVCSNFEPFPDEEDFSDDGEFGELYDDDGMLCDDDIDLMDFTGDEDFDEFCDHEDFESDDK